MELVKAGKVRKIIASHIGTTPDVVKAYHAGELEVELVPQGTLAEQMRAGGAGLGGFLTPTGLGTVVAEGKQHIEVDGKTYLLEKAIRADVALVRAHDGDTWGNLQVSRHGHQLQPAVRRRAPTTPSPRWSTSTARARSPRRASRPLDST